MTRALRGRPIPKDLRIVHILRNYTAAASLQYKDLAKEWGCSQSTVSRFMAGSHMPDGHTMMRIVAWMLKP